MGLPGVWLAVSQLAVFGFPRSRLPGLPGLELARLTRIRLARRRLGLPAHATGTMGLPRTRLTASQLVLSRLARSRLALS